LYIRFNGLILPMSVIKYIIEWVHRTNFTDQIWPVERRIRKMRRLDKPIGYVMTDSSTGSIFKNQKIKNHANVEMGNPGRDSVGVGEISPARKSVYA